MPGTTAAPLECRNGKAPQRNATASASESPTVQTAFRINYPSQPLLGKTQHPTRSFSAAPPKEDRATPGCHFSGERRRELLAPRGQQTCVCAEGKAGSRGLSSCQRTDGKSRLRSCPRPERHGLWPERGQHAPQPGPGRQHGDRAPAEDTDAMERRKRGLRSSRRSAAEHCSEGPFRSTDQENLWSMCRTAAPQTYFQVPEPKREELPTALCCLWRNQLLHICLADGHAPLVHPPARPSANLQGVNGVTPEMWLKGSKEHCCLLADPQLCDS